MEGLGWSSVNGAAACATSEMQQDAWQHTFSKIVKDTVYALAAVLTHHAWINSPFSDEGNYMVLHVVELREHRVAWANRAIL